MRVVLDTNVLISAVLFGGLPPRQLLTRALAGEFMLVSSSGLLDELEDLLQEKFGFTRVAARLTRAEFEAAADLAVPAEIPARSRDRDDDHVLATAVAGSADVIVTGDKDLLVLGQHEGIAILNPRAFLDRAE